MMSLSSDQYNSMTSMLPVLWAWILAPEIRAFSSSSRSASSAGRSISQDTMPHPYRPAYVPQAVAHMRWATARVRQVDGTAITGVPKAARSSGFRLQYRWPYWWGSLARGNWSRWKME